MPLFPPNALARLVLERAVILAAGRSTRMGHPKALTSIDGESALERIARACERAGLARPVVVLGVHHDVVREKLRALDGRVAWVRNPSPDAGRTGSLQVGLARLPEAGAVLVWPVDHPLVPAETARALLDARGEWVVPEHEGRGGHPIVLRGRALDAVRAARAETPLRDVLAASGLEPTRIAADASVLRNLDTPGDLSFP